MKFTYNKTAYAKINLFLRCCGKYDNGYHRLFMLMQQISLGDDIYIELDDSRDFKIEIESGVDIPCEKDLGYRAAKAFYDAYAALLESRGEASDLPYTFIRQTKKVPSQAGLGGGSSDAATVLVTLQKHFGEPLGQDEMLRISSRLGADVPFFLAGGTCICEGVGEIVTKLPGLAGVNAVLVKPSEGVSTAECYKLSDEMYKPFDENSYKARMNKIFSDDKLEPIERIIKAGDDLINDLQPPAVELLPRITGINEAIKETGAAFAAMTGSGSCVFGIYRDETARDEAVARLSSDPRISGCKIIPSALI